MKLAWPVDRIETQMGRRFEQRKGGPRGARLGQRRERHTVGGSAGRIDHVQDWLRGALTRPAKQAGAIRTAWPAFGFQIDRELWVLANAFICAIAQIKQLATNFLRLEAGEKAVSHQRFFPTI